MFDKLDGAEDGSVDLRGIRLIVEIQSDDFDSRTVSVKLAGPDGRVLESDSRPNALHAGDTCYFVLTINEPCKRWQICLIA